MTTHHPGHAAVKQLILRVQEIVGLKEVRNSLNKKSANLHIQRTVPFGKLDFCQMTLGKNLHSMNVGRHTLGPDGHGHKSNLLDYIEPTIWPLHYVIDSVCCLCTCMCMCFCSSRFVGHWHAVATQ